MIYTKEYIEKLDKKNRFIPLTFDYAFKYIMVKNIDIFKRFLIETLRLGINEEDVELIILDSSLWKSKKNEHGKTVDLNVKIDNNLLLTIEMNKYDFNNVKIRNQLFVEKLHTLQYEVGEKYKVLKTKYITQLNLNARDDYKDKGENTILLYDVTDKIVYNDTLKIVIKHLEYYKEMFYTDNKLMKFDEIFMAALMSNSYTELYNIMSRILLNEELNKFMESVIDMFEDGFVLHEWAKEEMDKLVAEETKKNEERKKQEMRAMEQELKNMEREIKKQEKKVKKEEKEVKKQEKEVKKQKEEVKKREQEIKKQKIKNMEEEKIEIIKIMLKKKMSYEDISEISSKSIGEIKEIEKSMNN